MTNEEKEIKLIVNWKEQELIDKACDVFDKHLQEMRRKDLLDINECFKLGIAFRKAMEEEN